MDSPDGKDDDQFAELEDIVEYELLLLYGQLSVVGHYGYELTDDLQETIVEHECWHSFHSLKKLGRGGGANLEACI